MDPQNTALQTREREIIDGYDIFEPIGKGGAASVYKANLVAFLEPNFRRLMLLDTLSESLRDIRELYTDIEADKPELTDDDRTTIEARLLEEAHKYLDDEKIKKGLITDKSPEELRDTIYKNIREAVQEHYSERREAMIEAITDYNGNNQGQDEISADIDSNFANKDYIARCDEAGLGEHLRAYISARYAAIAYSQETRLRAIKLPDLKAVPKSEADERAIRRFLLEGRVTMHIDHPNVIDTYACDFIYMTDKLIYQEQMRGDEVVGSKIVTNRERERLEKELNEKRVELEKRRKRKDTELFRVESQADILELEGKITDLEGTLSRGKIYYCVIPYIPCEDLEKVVLDYKEDLYIILKVIEGVRAGHDKHTLHRDIKPKNILVKRKDENGNVLSEPEVVVADWGLAKEYQGLQEEDGSISLVGQILGTPDYMCKEQVTGMKKSVRWDVYQIGGTLYRLITKHNFRAENTTNPMEHILSIIKGNEEIPWPRERDLNISNALEDVIMMMTANDPENKLSTFESRYLLREIFDRGIEAANQEREYHESNPLSLFNELEELDEINYILSRWGTREDLEARQNRITQVLNSSKATKKICKEKLNQYALEGERINRFLGAYDEKVNKKPELEELLGSLTKLQKAELYEQAAIRLAPENRRQSDRRKYLLQQSIGYYETLAKTYDSSWSSDKINLKELVPEISERDEDVKQQAPASEIVQAPKPLPDPFDLGDSEETHVEFESVTAVASSNLEGLVTELELANESGTNEETIDATPIIEPKENKVNNNGDRWRDDPEVDYAYGSDTIELKNITDRVILLKKRQALEDRRQKRFGILKVA